MTVLEICVEDLAGVRAAAVGGAQRVELCVNLHVGGTTAPLELVREAAPLAPPGGLAVMIRPRGGNFYYHPGEVEQMVRAAAAVAALASQLPVPVQLVTGALRKTGGLDEAALGAVSAAGQGLQMVCHRAFDLLPDLEGGLEQLAKLGYSRVLTTGGDPAKARLKVLARLVKHPAGITILGSGGLRPANLAAVVQQTGLQEVHLRAPFPAGRPGTDPTVVAAARAALN